jgi:hypothetical protein
LQLRATGTKQVERAGVRDQAATGEVLVAQITLQRERAVVGEAPTANEELVAGIGIVVVDQHRIAGADVARDAPAAAVGRVVDDLKARGAGIVGVQIAADLNRVARGRAAGVCDAPVEDRTAVVRERPARLREERPRAGA